MYRTSAEQVFASIARIRERAEALLRGGGATLPRWDDDGEREALTLASDVALRLPALRDTFGLDGLATSALLCLVAVEYDPFLRTYLRGTQREAGRPWIELGSLAELLGLAPTGVPDLARHFAPTSPLRRYALVELDDGPPASPRVSTKTRVATRVAEHLVGSDALPVGFSLLASPRRTLGESLIAEETRRALLARMARAQSSGAALVVELHGAPGVGKRHLAEGLAEGLARPLLVVDLADVDVGRLGERLAEARREAALAGALPCLAHWQASYLSPSSPAREEAPAATSPRHLPVPWVELFQELDGVLLLTGEEPEMLLDRHAPNVAHVHVPFPTPSQRALLLERMLRDEGAVPAADVDAHAIVRRFALDPGRLRAAARSAVARARERCGDEWITVERLELDEACRAQLRHDLQSLAVRVTSSYRWEDLVIPVDVYHGLCEMVSYVKHAHRVYDEWGLGARHSLAQGVSALFAGPPGTGKTMCASVMARELDMELFRVDLSRVVSKWIGETEKNLAKVFDEAQRSNAIILFDEADSLFARRTEVKSSVDRYANLEVNYLLQRMEAFSGVTILTTNFEDTIDTAFKRRLTFRLRFEKPDAGARAALWQKVFPSMFPLAPDFDPAALGRAFELSGGNIRSAAVRAAFLAAEAGKPVDQAVCLLAAEREAREMGLLTRSAALPPVEEPEEPEPPATPKRTTPLIPITHPRR